MNSKHIPQEYWEKEVGVNDPGDENDFAEDKARLAEAIRAFESGATRNNDSDELDYEGFFSPLAMKAFAEYMHEHRHQSDGTVRDSDNWQKGIPLDSYAKSMFRHFMDFWLHHRGEGERARETLHEALCGLFFNVQGYLHEVEKM